MLRNNRNEKRHLKKRNYVNIDLFTVHNSTKIDSVEGDLYIIDCYERSYFPTLKSLKNVFFKA